MSNLEFARAQARDTKIKLHGPEAFAAMRKAGRLAAEALDLLVDQVRPGVTTEAIDALVVEFAIDHGAIPAPLYYRGYPKAICTSINHVVCHGIPNDKPLREGDIVNIDVTLIVDGWHGDSSRMYGVGEITREGRAAAARSPTNALMRGIAAVKPGASTGDIGHAIQSLCRGRALFGGARFLRPRPGPRLPRPSQHPALWPPRRRAWSSSPACSSPSSR